MAKHIDKDVCDYAPIILNNVTEGVFTIEKDRRITYFNKAAEKISGISADEAVGRFCYNIFRTNICETECALLKTIKTSEPVISELIYTINQSGEQIPMSISTAALMDSSGNVMGGVEILRDLTLIDKLRKEIENKYTFSDIISKNSKMQRIFSILPQIAESSCAVLIEGDSGTGKELFARVIHNLSKRKDKHLVAVNCGALPDTLLESELFGYKAGAFTDAKKDKKGRFAQADKGTIFLDEIGDTSPAFQIRLLRFLQEKTYEPLGSTVTEKADVRVIAATNKNLAHLVDENIFRRDLFYRVNIIKITIPPLRERPEDIPLLIRHFISKYNGIMCKNIESVSPDVLDILMKHPFPGNVRELENIIEHAFVLCRNTVIESKHLPIELAQPKSSAVKIEETRNSLNQAERQTIIDALKKNSWNRLAAAKYLGIHKTTLFRKVKKLKIELPTNDGRNQKRTSA